MNDLSWLLTAGSPLSGQNFDPTSFPSQDSTSFYFFLGFIAFIVVLRLYRGIRGRVYRNSIVLRPPIAYIVLTLISVVFLGLVDNVLLLTLLFIPAGTLLGYRFGTNVKFFSRRGVVYYSRSPIMLSIWLASFMGRLVLEFIFPDSLNIIFILDAVLSLTTGLLLGEALNIIHMRKAYVQPERDDADEDDRFIIANR